MWNLSVDLACQPVVTILLHAGLCRNSRSILWQPRREAILVCCDLGLWRCSQCGGTGQPQWPVEESHQWTAWWWLSRVCLWLLRRWVWRVGRLANMVCTCMCVCTLFHSMLVGRRHSIGWSVEVVSSYMYCACVPAVFPRWTTLDSLIPSMVSSLRHHILWVHHVWLCQVTASGCVVSVPLAHCEVICLADPLSKSITRLDWSLMFPQLKDNGLHIIHVQYLYYAYYVLWTVSYSITCMHTHNCTCLFVHSRSLHLHLSRCVWRHF